jgi:hypothetical protein
MARSLPFPCEECDRPIVQQPYAWRGGDANQTVHYFCCELCRARFMHSHSSAHPVTAEVRP